MLMRRRRFLLFNNLRRVIGGWTARLGSCTGELIGTDDKDKYIYLILPGLAFSRLCLTIVMITVYSGEECTQSRLKDVAALSNLETDLQYGGQHNLFPKGQKPDRQASESNAPDRVRPGHGILKQ